ncbi:hypothetical protein E4T38_08334 [Aureobasidium subglaciale]|nr:hypothetical protein E4T38_08334 [Aureobasidium subglaciale]KAI5213517.1 hypothetical protein E4T40_09661 [Aureobasidium subglaciale]KAI5215174.1 hypothetical protein E4T41_09699 [Aureobasidium subglaciale]KAI5256455.1 hypothetical protein E4T46_08234 [Aureobasidium subglaciale]
MSGSGSVRRQASAIASPKPPCTIHPSAIISDKAVIVGTHPISIGENVVLHPFAKITSNTGAVRIGKNCVVGDRATVGLSDSPGSYAGTTVELEDGVSVESGSTVQAEKVGAGSTIEANSTLGPGVVIGMVSITPMQPIMQTLPDFTVVYGENARRIDTTTKTRSDVRDLKVKGQLMHIETLKRLLGPCSEDIDTPKKLLRSLQMKYCRIGTVERLVKVTTVLPAFRPKRVRSLATSWKTISPRPIKVFLLSSDVILKIMFSLSILRRSRFSVQTRAIMSQKLSYSAAAGSADIPKPQPHPNSPIGKHSTANQQQHASGEQQGNTHGRSTHKRNTSPSHVPKTQSSEEAVYVLTLLTDAKHHRTLTETRKKYFPPRLNRLEAHITLFHALPGSLLEEKIKPTLREVSSNTTQFHLLAATPFRLNKGIAIGLPKSSGGDDARQVHQQLKFAWEDFLSRQDAGGFAAHYTIMNKVDDEKEVQKAFEQVQEEWKGCHGTVLGLSLFKYDRGNWVHDEDFKFAPSQ